MSLERDHHGVVAEVVSPQSPVQAWLLGALALCVALGLVFALQVSLWALLGWPTLAALAVKLGPELLSPARRVQVRLTEEYLSVEVEAPLRPREITRVALRSIREVQPTPGALRLEVESLGTVIIPCPPRLREELLAHIDEAIEAAPRPELRRTERPPEALQQMRQPSEGPPR